MAKRVPAAARGALLPLVFPSAPVAAFFACPFFFAGCCSRFSVWLRWPFFPAGFRRLLWVPAIKRNSPTAARQEFLRDDEFSVANQLSSPGEDMGYFEGFPAQDQRVGVTALLQSPFPIQFQNSRRVRGYQRQDLFERKAVFSHACANLVIEGARAQNRRVR